MIGLTTNGIVINEYGDVLLIVRNDTRTLAPPGGGIELGELATDSVAREIEEETGIIAMPVRLTGLYYWDWSPERPILAFMFRCIQRGGKLQSSNESPQVGFFSANPLPRSLIPIHRERVLEAWQHEGGPPVWKRQRLTGLERLGRLVVQKVIYPWYDWQRRRKGVATYVAPPLWQVDVFVVMEDAAGRLLWQQGADGMWRLPGGRAVRAEAPWETAVSLTEQQLNQPIRLTDLTAVYVTEGEAHITFLFAAEWPHGVDEEDGGKTAVFPADQPPTPTAPQQKTYVDDTLSNLTETIFRYRND